MEEIPVFDLEESEAPVKRDYKPYIFAVAAAVLLLLSLYRIGQYFYTKHQLSLVQAELKKYEGVKNLLEELKVRKAEVQLMVEKIKELNALKQRDFSFFSRIPSLASPSLKFQSLDKNGAKVVLTGVAAGLESYRVFLSKLEEMEEFRRVEKQKYVDGTFKTELFLKKEVAK